MEANVLVTAETDAGEYEPICIDLDGTFVKTDLMLEMLLKAAGQHWAVLLTAPVWLTHGKAYFKQELAKRCTLDIAHLPFDEELRSYLKRQRERGHRLVLATAADRKIAEAIAAEAGIIDEVIASDGITNLKGETKARVLEDRFGNRGFIYVGNDRCDLPIWRKAKEAVVVNASSYVTRAAAAATTVRETFAARESSLVQLLKAMRTYQWAKNILVFIAPLTALVLWEPAIALASLVIFFAFCATASGVYIINDLLDLDSDRQHPRKRYRPFASGKLPLQYGLYGPILVSIGIIFGSIVSSECGLAIVTYAVLSIAYSVSLKKKPLIDVFVLASLYSLRLLTGGLATDVSVSTWLLSFSSFLFLALAFLKRTAELAALRSEEKRKVSGRGYGASDLSMLKVMGVACSFVSSLVLALYIDSTTARTIYANPNVLWGIVPLILFWQCRLWLSTARGRMHDDPIVYAAKDRISWLIFGLIMVIFGIANLDGIPWG
ncbi:MAG: UbiA family prenyltransferase [Gammaproteobacteria bacterium]|nr:UbiA family prenyltransferase [Gammaproteobacteria bacterium]